MTVEHVPVSDLVTTIGPVVDGGDGSYGLTLPDPGHKGIDIILIIDEIEVRTLACRMSDAYCGAVFLSLQSSYITT